MSKGLIHIALKVVIRKRIVSLLTRLKNFLCTPMVAYRVIMLITASMFFTIMLIKIHA
jgi:hypothetical protein